MEWLSEYRSVIMTLSSLLLIAGFLVIAARGSKARKGHPHGAGLAQLDVGAVDSTISPSASTVEASSDVVALLPPTDSEIAGEYAGVRPGLYLYPFQLPPSGEGEKQLAEELHDDIVAVLSRGSDIAVIGRKAGEWDASSSLPVRSLERELGVRYALSGDITKRDDRVRFTIHLLEAPTGSSMWSRQFDVGRSIPNDRSLLVNQIAGGVTAEVLRAEAEVTVRQEPERLSAESLTNRARHRFLAFNRRTYHEIEQLARMAIDLKPSLPAAHGILAGALAMKAHQSWTELPEEDLEEAFSEGGRAVELSPGNPRMLFWWGHVHFYGGRTEDSIGILERAASGDPSYVPAYILHGAALIMAGMTSNGIASIDHALELAPDHAQAYQAHLWRGIGSFELDDIPSAQKAFLASVNQNVIKNPTDSAAAFWAWYGTAATYRQLEHERDSDVILERLRQRFNAHDYAIMLEHAEESFAPNLRSLKMVATVEKEAALVDMEEHRSLPKPPSLRNMFKRTTATTGS